jgi:AraC family transcriptional regulator, regulatory protein of adaptative response / DNA-3-methyladenine glycosylase II
MRAAFGCPPGDLRRGKLAEGIKSGGNLVLRPGDRLPLPAGPLLGWLAARALPDIEEVHGGGRVPSPGRQRCQER